MSDYRQKVELIKSKIKTYPDFPKPGIKFKDVFGVLNDGPSCKLLQELLVHNVKTHFPDVEAVIGLESRGFFFAFSLASELSIKCIPIRKKGKLPGKLKKMDYVLEYGTDTFEIQSDSITKGLKCIIVDDLLATGGSLDAAVQLLTSLEANVLGCLVVIELAPLKGREKVEEGKLNIRSIVDLHLEDF